ncbi:MAG: threonine/serine exporter family protein [Oscillospiraceae bacterium]|nr:threonine/serine exporter family protein [Oscillospiraceae bacterium]
MTECELVQICSYFAKYMISCGAEIHRVEDTIRRICRAYSKPRAQIYCTPANFIITIQDRSGTPVTMSVAVGSRKTNLDRVGAYNNLSRWVCSRKPDAQSIKEKLNDINSRPVYPTTVVYASFFLVGAAATFAVGGGIIEALIGAVLAMLIKLINDKLNSVQASTFFKSVVSSMVISFIAVWCQSMGAVPHFDKMIIGAATTMVPGVAITNCMRDFISGDFYSGIYSLTEALLTAIGLAVGSGTALAAAIS